LLEAARYHRVVAPVHRALSGVGAADARVREQLARLYHEAVASHLRVRATLRHASGLLEGLDAPWLVVKGPVLTDVVYRRSGLRLYHDLDLIVPRAAFADAVNAMERGGFAIRDRNWALIRRLEAGELNLVGPGGAAVDLHWHLLFNREDRSRFRIDMDELISRARSVEAGGLQVSTLDEADTLIHLAVGACAEGGGRLSWLKDLERSIVNDRPDWAAVIERSRSWGANLAVGTMLLRARRSLSAPVPDDVVRELVPSWAWRQTLSSLDRLFPPERSSAIGTPATLVARSTRRAVSSTLSTVAQGGTRRLSRLLRTGDPRRAALQDDPTSPASLLFPDGGERERELFLEHLSQHT
jgi:hypothetical protein